MDTFSHCHRILTADWRETNTNYAIPLGRHGDTIGTHPHPHSQSLRSVSWGWGVWPSWYSMDQNHCEKSILVCSDAEMAQQIRVLAWQP